MGLTANFKDLRWGGDICRGMKTCQYCGITLILKQRKNCLECSLRAKRDRNKQWHKENKTHRAKKDKITHQSPSYRWHLLRKNAQKRELEVLLCREEFEQISILPCYYCEGILDTDSGWGSHIDRLDNNLGYTINNSVSCCGFCNKIKQDLLTPIETKEVIRIIIKLRGNTNARITNSKTPDTISGNTNLPNIT